MMGHIMSGQCLAGYLVGYCLNGMTLSAPHQDVLDAWNQGWTGSGKSILMIDGYAATNPNAPTPLNFMDMAHGLTTMTLANRYAYGSSIYGLDRSLNNDQSLQTGTIKNWDGSAASGTNINVINTSFGANYWAIVGRQGVNVTSADVTTVFNTTQTAANTWAKLLDGRITYTGFTLTDAVITKSAGNDSITADKESYVKTYATNPNINPRLLVVGALNFAGSTSYKATLATYSNTAGTDPSVATRFLVASGTDPFATGAVAVDGSAYNPTDSMGTSFAAPRVAGFAAIIRQKFPNLNGEKTASILLDTARTDTLTCYPNCDSTIYGKGEASLSRALAPVGRLR